MKISATEFLPVRGPGPGGRSSRRFSCVHLLYSPSVATALLIELTGICACCPRGRQHQAVQVCLRA